MFFLHARSSISLCCPVRTIPKSPAKLRLRQHLALVHPAASLQEPLPKLPEVERLPLPDFDQTLGSYLTEVLTHYTYTLQISLINFKELELWI